MVDTEELRNQREYGDTGIKLYYWRADRRRCGHCAGNRHCGRDYKNTDRELLDKKSKSEKENRRMESMRDIDRVMEREIAKGSCPMKLDKIELGDYSYQEIMSQEKLLEVLSYLFRIGDYKEYAGKTVINNVYMDFKGKKAIFKRAKSVLERSRIFSAIKRYVVKKAPDYEGMVYLETARCFFTVPEENLVKYKYEYEGQETYAFIMSDKYILGLYTHCLVARREMAGGSATAKFPEKEREIVSMEAVKDVLFQCLLLDDVHLEDGIMYMNFYTIYVLNGTEQSI